LHQAFYERYGIVKVLFDTSVIVAAIIEAHPRHEESLPWLQKVKNNEIEGVISSHASIELYSVLTSLPVSPRISPALARQLIRENIFKSFGLITCTKNDHISLLQRLVENQIIGGASYDGLIAYAAEKAKVDKLLTLNSEDFLIVNPSAASIISEP
jgi:predicted nucleic acid-binding protein